MDTVEFPQSRCHAGVARRDITPPVGIYHRMWGAATHDRSTGIHRPLTATVMVLQSENSSDDATKPVVFVTVDHCLLWNREMNELLDRVSDSSGVERSQIIVFFSHTHAAGLMGNERVDLPGGELTCCRGFGGGAPPRDAGGVQGDRWASPERSKREASRFDFRRS